jgi:hypothetical protein
VQALAGQLGRLHKGDGQPVHPRGQPDGVEPAPGHRMAADQGRGVGDRHQGPADVLVQASQGPPQLGQHLGRDPERHRRLQHRGRPSPGRPSQLGQHLGQQRVPGQAPDRLVVGVQGGAQGVHGGRGRGQQLPGQPLAGPEPGQGQGGGQWRPGQQGDPLLGLELVGEDPPLGQGLAGVGGHAARVKDQPGPDQGRERVGQGDHLPGAAEPAPGHGRDEAVVDPVGQEPAQLGPDPGVAAQ